MLTAYVDESMRSTLGGPRCYVLAAALIPDSQARLVREAVESLLLRGQSRLHFYEESTTRRRKLCEAVAAVGCSAVVVVGEPLDLRRQERARRQCLTRLIWELRGLDVARIVCESRGSHRDRADLQALVGLRRSGILRSDVRLEHASPVGRQAEIMLWVADIIAGACTHSRGGDLALWTPLAAEVDLVEIRLT